MTFCVICSQQFIPSLLCLSQGKLELITGATASFMQLQLLDRNGKLVCELDDDDCTLESYPVETGYRIHVSVCIFCCGRRRILQKCIILQGWLIVGDLT